MPDCHGDTELLVIGELWIRSVDLLAAEPQDQRDDNRSSILHKEDGRPGDLRAKVFEDKGHLIDDKVFTQRFCLIREGHNFGSCLWSLNRESQSLRAKLSLL